jgi:hypothetical protein
MSICEAISAEFRAGPVFRRRIPAASPAFPAIAPGQLWIMQLCDNGAVTEPVRRAFDAANVVIYDRALADTVADLLPLGGYAEPAAAQEAAAARCVRFARDGWSVIRAVPARLPQRERTRCVQDIVDEFAAAKIPGRLPVTVFAQASDGIEELRNARFDDLATITATHPRDTLLTVVIDAFAVAPQARLHLVAGNGLAG